MGVRPTLRSLTPNRYFARTWCTCTAYAVRSRCARSVVTAFTHPIARDAANCVMKSGHSWRHRHYWETPVGVGDSVDVRACGLQNWPSLGVLGILIVRTVQGFVTASRASRRTCRPWENRPWAEMRRQKAYGKPASQQTATLATMRQQHPTWMT